MKNVITMVLCIFTWWFIGNPLMRGVTYNSVVLRVWHAVTIKKEE